MHAIVGALYGKSIQLKPGTVEMTLRTAHYLGMGCIIDACVTYITRHVVQFAPLEVLPCLPGYPANCASRSE